MLKDINSNITKKEYVQKYCNYYEFSTNKEAVAELSKSLVTSPWKIEIGGLVENPQFLSIADLKQLAVYDRTYRFRCVEGWSMVVPWRGVLLKDLVSLVKPKKEAGFVVFESLFRPKEMIAQRRGTMPWPYTEGLRLDEAVHPLTLLATGMYGDELAPQNGAPIRLIVPWKYGFKSIKAITKITFQKDRPISSWQKISPGEYGFYANVNPAVAHPRWSQRRELPLGEYKKIRTLAFNGYEEEVAKMYKGMDLNKNF